MSIEQPVSAMRRYSEKDIADVHSGYDPTRTLDNGEENPNRATRAPTRLTSYIRKFEQQLVEYNFEARGIERVPENERMTKLTWIAYLQSFLLWVSINLAANNITLGMLGPAIYGLSFRDTALCAVFGALLGSIPAAWMATRGPVSGIRTMVSEEEASSRILR